MGLCSSYRSSTRVSYYNGKASLIISIIEFNILGTLDIPVCPSTRVHLVTRDRVIMVSQENIPFEQFCIILISGQSLSVKGVVGSLSFWGHRFIGIRIIRLPNI